MHLQFLTALILLLVILKDRLYKKTQLFLSIYYVYLIPIRRVNIADKCPQENFF